MRRSEKNKKKFPVPGVGFVLSAHQSETHELIFLAKTDFDFVNLSICLSLHFNACIRHLQLDCVRPVRP